MNKLMSKTTAALFAISTYGVSAAPITVTDKNNLSNEDSPQQIQQSNAVNERTTTRVNTQRQYKLDSRKMDANGNGMVSKDEYLSYHEANFSSMKQTNGEVRIQDIQSGKISLVNKSSMNNKPIGTTTGQSNNGSTDDTKLDMPVNGTKTGTNR